MGGISMVVVGVVDQQRCIGRHAARQQAPDADVAPNFKNTIFWRHLTLEFGWIVVVASFEDVQTGSFDEVLLPGYLPHGLRSLTFGAYFNQPLEIGVLPSTITNLAFGQHFDHPLGLGVLPSELTCLSFGEHFNQQLAPRVLPEGLTNLTFSSDFNQPLPQGVLPMSLETLVLGNLYMQPLSSVSLPPSLVNLGRILVDDRPTTLIRLNLTRHQGEPIDYNRIFSTYSNTTTVQPEMIYQINQSRSYTLRLLNIQQSQWTRVHDAISDLLCDLEPSGSEIKCMHISPDHILIISKLIKNHMAIHTLVGVAE
eukprot:gene11970-13962_t